MIDQYFIKIFKPFLELVASPFYKFGVNANYISLIGLSLSFLSFYLILKGLNNLALFVFLLGRILDGVDGIIANKERITEFGGFIDIVFDLISYSLVPLAFILNDKSNAIFGSILFATFLHGLHFTSKSLNFIETIGNVSCSYEIIFLFIQR